jgi:carboxymethylenebutenolidase
MLIQSHVADLSTPTGVMRTYVHRPVDNKSGDHKKVPAILFYSEIFQQTGPIERAARFMAGQGYAVLVPEVFHELNPIGTVLGYDDAGRDKGNADKAAKDVQGYDTDNRAMIEWLSNQDWYNGNLGAKRQMAANAKAHCAKVTVVPVLVT